METVYDWVCLGIFAGLIVLFLQRSTSAVEEREDSLLLYLAAGVGCATGNYFGNSGQELVAVLVIAVTLAFIVRYLKPFQSARKS